MPKSTKKSYKDKIDPVTVYIICEGAVDEYLYFKNFQKNINKRFRPLIKVVPIERTSTKSSPLHVLEEAKEYIKEHNIKLRDHSNSFFILLDKDQNFKSGTKIANTVNYMKQCTQMGIQTAFVAPAFEIWLLLHYIDLSAQDDAYLKKIIANKAVSRNNSFTKNEVSSKGINSCSMEILKLIHSAIENEEKVNRLYAGTQLENDLIWSDVGKIFKTIERTNIVGILTFK
ncbi:RloB domain-containing protein [Alteromonas sp. ZYF713]|nr:RloB domain-containing protein [Alteromonas sp. ZYF713]